MEVQRKNGMKRLEAIGVSNIHEVAVVVVVVVGVEVVDKCLL